MFPIIELDRRQQEATEQLGSKSKFWFTPSAGKRLLFKAEERGTGEDWAEKIACELAEILGLPHVHYELAREVSDQIPGVVCPSCLAAGQALAHGNQLLLAADPGYALTQRRLKVAGHTPAAVATVVSRFEPPPHPWTTEACAGLTSLDIFAGYVLLDAWIANQDRHHENWGAIRHEGILFLAPTYDHGASLARNLSDEERLDRLHSQDERRGVGHFVRRARSKFFASPAEERALTTVAAWNAFAVLAPQAAQHWLARLDSVNHEAVRGILEQVPPQRLSSVGREFTLLLLEENRHRLLTHEAE